MSYDEELKDLQDELRVKSEKAFAMDTGGKDGPGAENLRSAVSEYNRKLIILKQKYQIE